MILFDKHLVVNNIKKIPVIFHNRDFKTFKDIAYLLLPKIRSRNKNRFTKSR